MLFGNDYAVAEQDFRVADGDTVMAIASQQEITRIKLAGEKIAGLHYIDNEFNYNIYGGEIYITASIKNKLLNFFARTESGKTYKFILEIKDIPATQIFVRSKKVAITPFYHLKGSSGIKTSALERKISQLLRVLESEEKHVGFILETINKRKSRQGKLVLRSVLRAQGKGLVGEKLIVKNNSNTVIKLQKNDFMTAGIIGVYLAQDELAPQTETILMRIRRGA